MPKFSKAVRLFQRKYYVGYIKHTNVDLLKILKALHLPKLRYERLTCIWYQGVDFSEDTLLLYQQSEFFCLHIECYIR